MKPGGPNASIQLAVADLDTTEAFYRGILELPMQRALTAIGGPEHLILKNGEWELIFVAEAAVVHTHPLMGEPLAAHPKGVGMTLQFRVNGIEDIFEAIVDEGLEIFYPLEKKPYGVKDFWCFDPDGYLVALEEPWGELKNREE
jgi:catechol 2,3-dioxygenase-like lactoylglutathione lyase family enzyme